MDDYIKLELNDLAIPSSSGKLSKMHIC